MTIGLGHYLTVAAILFTLGVFGIFLNRKNVIIILMAVELILLAVNLNLVAFSSFLHDLTGQIFALLVLTVAAAEAAIGLAILVVFYLRRGHDRGRGHQHDEGLRRKCIRRSSSCRCSARSLRGSSRSSVLARVIPAASRRSVRRTTRTVGVAMPATRRRTGTNRITSRTAIITPRHKDHAPQS
jgi:NADH-quinone oxidoreductase subunit K